MTNLQHLNMHVLTISDLHNCVPMAAVDPDRDTATLGSCTANGHTDAKIENSDECQYFYQNRAI